MSKMYFAEINYLSLNVQTRNVIRRHCNKDRDQGPKRMSVIGIDRVVTYSIYQINGSCGNCVLCVYSAYTDLGYVNSI